MALNLPVSISVFEDANGQIWATFDDPTGVAPSHGLSADHLAVSTMKSTLEKFSARATGE